ncbi:MAG: hypothetical protein Q9162_003588 [Coniocarpon cinnabarinum]
MSHDYILNESSVGYAVFQIVRQPDTVGNALAEVQKDLTNLALFGQMVKVVSFMPFKGAQHALENINEISEGLLPDYLRDTIDTALPKPSKKHIIKLGVAEKNLAGSIKEAFPNLEVQTADTDKIVADLIRGIRLHQDKLLGKLQSGDVERAQLGLGHSYSRAKVKFNVNRNDNHIIQAIATLDHLDKAVNQFSMRVREWYGWHFPELVRIVSDNYTYARLVLAIKDKRSLTSESEYELAAIVSEDALIARSIIDAAKVSMGQDVAELDMENIEHFAKRVVNLTEYRKTLSAYLIAKMSSVAPNLATLIGETVAARLISHAGSLTNLAKYPASTVQILGAEKALFRALKTKSNTPKYGLIYHSSFIGRAGLKNKGRISRFLANKCSIASRIDNFSELPSTRFGDALKKQVEERLEFYSSGTAPTKNEDAMKAAMDGVLREMANGQAVAGAEEQDADVDDAMADAVDEAESKDERRKRKEEKRKAKEEKKAKKETKLNGEVSKKDKKRKTIDGDDGGERKKKKKEKHKHSKD